MQTNQTFQVGDLVDVIHACWIGTGKEQEHVTHRSRVIVRITHQSSDGTPLYWLDGVSCARTANVLRKAVR